MGEIDQATADARLPTLEKHLSPRQIRKLGLAPGGIKVHKRVTRQTWKPNWKDTWKRINPFKDQTGETK